MKKSKECIFHGKKKVVFFEEKCLVANVKEDSEIKI